MPYFRTIEKDKIAEGGTALIASLLKDENQVIRIVVMQKLP